MLLRNNVSLSKLSIGQIEQDISEAQRFIFNNFCKRFVFRTSDLKY